MHEADNETSDLTLRLGKLSLRARGATGIAAMFALLFVFLGLVVWTVGVTYVALSGVTVETIADAALLKAAAILGAFVLFGYLVSASEKLRWRERQLDTEFERGRPGNFGSDGR